MTKTFRLSVAILLGTVGLIPFNVQAGLIGVGRTVQAFYFNGVLLGPEAEINAATMTTVAASLTAPVSYLQGAASGSTIVVADTQITITNLVSGFPFCVLPNSGTACTDQIDGFDLLFTGENILGVSVDPASAPAFLPVSGTFQGNTHLGLQLLSNNEIRVDVTGDLPSLNDKLILDLRFSATPPPTVPEPASLALLGLGLAGLGFSRRKQD